MIAAALQAVAGKAVSAARGGARRMVRARFDAAGTNASNAGHWAGADGLSADAAMTPGVRRTLRNRARYEVANNSYAKGIVLSLAMDLIGTGPRLQMRTGDAKADIEIEAEFAAWCDAIGLPEKLLTMRMARADSGEAFLVSTTNAGLGNRVTLDWKLIEADQVETPGLSLLEPDAVDGIRFDAYGNPVEYHILREHPGGQTLAQIDLYDKIAAEHVIHYFRADRPGQSRGVPDLTPALPLFAMLRRYTLAVLGSAETAANIPLVIESDAPPDDGPDAVDSMDTFELEPNTATTLPMGWSLNQLKAEQPTTTYPEFKGELLDEIVRCVLMPSSIARGNSSDYNFASGRLDRQSYDRAIRIERRAIERRVLERLFNAWRAEAVRITGLLTLPTRQRLATTRAPKHAWFWDGLEHAVDPAKQATARETSLRSMTTTYARVYAEQGLDWEEEFRQIGREKALMADLGITPADLAPSAAPPPQEPADAD